MNILDRFILGIYTFCIAVISAVIILIGTNVIDYSTVIYYAQIIVTNSHYMTVIIAFAAIFFLVSIRFLLSGPKNSKTKQAIKKKSELGNIMISLNSIQNIIMSAVKPIDGVMEVKIKVTNHRETVKTKLKVVVTPEQSIPNLSTKIQSRAKEVIEKIAGVEVSSIEVFVDNVVQTIKRKDKVKIQAQAQAE